PRARRDARVWYRFACSQESGGVVRGVEESDRSAPAPFAPIEVRAGAVLLGSGSAKYQTANPVPQSPNTCCRTGHYLVRTDVRKQHQARSQLKNTLFRTTFSTPTRSYANYRVIPAFLN